MVTVKELKEIIETLPDNMVIFSSEEGNEYAIDLENIHTWTKEEIISTVISEDGNVDEIEEEYQNGCLYIG